MVPNDEVPLPARYRHAAFLDLLADAAHGYRRAKSVDDPYEVSRAARASIIAACLSVECFANCLLDDLDAQSQLLDEIDKMQALAKIDLYLSLRGKAPLTRGDAPVQAAAELLRVRNAYVHPKIITISAEMQPFQEDEQEFVVPFTFAAAMWPVLSIPKHSLVWDKQAALRVLGAVASFVRYVLTEKLAASDDDLARLLLPRVEVAQVHMAAVYGEFAHEVNALIEDGVDFGFLKL